MLCGAGNWGITGISETGPQQRTLPVPGLGGVVVGAGSLSSTCLHLRISRKCPVGRGRKQTRRSPRRAPRTVCPRPRLTQSGTQGCRWGRGSGEESLSRARDPAARAGRPWSRTLSRPSAELPLPGPRKAGAALSCTGEPPLRSAVGAGALTPLLWASVPLCCEVFQRPRWAAADNLSLKALPSPFPVRLQPGGAGRVRASRLQQEAGCFDCAQAGPASIGLAPPSPCCPVSCRDCPVPVPSVPALPGSGESPEQPGPGPQPGSPTCSSASPASPAAVPGLALPDVVPPEPERLVHRPVRRPAAASWGLGQKAAGQPP